MNKEPTPVDVLANRFFRSSVFEEDIEEMPPLSPPNRVSNITANMKDHRFSIRKIPLNLISSLRSSGRQSFISRASSLFSDSSKNKSLYRGAAYC